MSTTREYCAELNDTSDLMTRSNSNLINYLENDTVGQGTPFTTPFGPKRMIYADWTASGKALRFIEKHITEDVLPFYGNTHTTTSITGLQSTCFRHEARQVVAQSVNANTRTDVTLFVGHGATGAVNRLVHVLGLHLPLPPNYNPNDRAIVFVGPHEHHSNLLPWRESSAEVIVIKENEQGCLDTVDLEAKLVQHSQRKVKIGTFAAASNVTGILAPVDVVTALLHRHGALSFWDYATAAPYVSIDMNPMVTGQDRTLVQKDAVFISPHKFLGGPNTPGILIAKKALFTNDTPAQPGGGTVFYVTENDHRYLSNRIEREEGGTPDIIGSIRAGLAFHVKSQIGVSNIEKMEHALWKQAKTMLLGQNSTSGTSGTNGTNGTNGTSGNNNNIVLLGNLNAARLPILSFMIRCPGAGPSKFLHYNYVCALLNDLYGIQSRGGCQCAGPYSQRLLGITTATSELFESALLDKQEFLRPGYTRLSLTYFMHENTVNYILNAIRMISKYGWRLMHLYRFNAKTGEWKHNSQMTKFSERIWSTRAATNHLPGFVSTMQQPGGQGGQRPGGGVNGVTTNEMKIYMESTSKEIEALLTSVQKPSGNATSDVLPGNEALHWCLFPSEIATALRDGVDLGGNTVGPNSNTSSAASTKSTAAVTPLEPARYGDQSMTVPTSNETNTLKRSRPKENKEKESETATTASNSSSTSSTSTSTSSTSSSSSSSSSTERAAKKTKFTLRTTNNSAPDTATARLEKLSTTSALLKTSSTAAKLFPKVPRKLMRNVGKAIMDWEMMREGDRILLGLSGGKDSLALLHILHALQKKSPVKWELAAVTVDPGTDAFDPSPLIPYLKSLGIPYFFLSERIIDRAKVQMQGNSICSFCARMKRGSLYSCARKNGYNVLALGQHLDDLAESFIMSALHNGQLRTMKAHYKNDDGDLRIIRPMAYVRESQTKEFSYAAKLPVINENCPACFEGPKERHRVKKLLATESNLFPGIFGNIKNAILPLMGEQMYHDMALSRKKIQERNGKNGRNGSNKKSRKKNDKSDGNGNNGNNGNSSSSSSSSTVKNSK